MELEPAFLDGIGEAGAELAASAAERDHERRVDALDVDAAVLDSFDALSELDHFAQRRLRIGIRSLTHQLHESAPAGRCAEL